MEQGVLTSQEDLGLKGWRPERSGSASQGPGEKGLWTKVGEASSLQACPQGSWGLGDTAFQGMAPSLTLSGWARSQEALGEFRLGSGQEVGVGPLGYWTAKNRNRPPSVPSPGLTPGQPPGCLFLLRGSV